MTGVIINNLVRRFFRAGLKLQSQMIAAGHPPTEPLPYADGDDFDTKHELGELETFAEQQERLAPQEKEIE